MKFKILQPVFERLVATAARAVDSHPNAPVLGNLLLEAKGGKLSVTGTRLSITVRVEDECDEISLEGAYTVKALTLLAWLSSLDRRLPVEVELDATAGSLHIRSGRSKTRIQGIDAEEFPSLPLGMQAPMTVSLAASALTKGIRSTVYAAASDDSNLRLMALLLEFRAETLVCQATDSRRMARAELPIRNPGQAETLVAVPSSSIKEVEHILSSYPDEQEVMITVAASGQNSLISFAADGLMIWAQVLDGAHKVASIESLLLPASTEMLVDAAQFRLLLAQARIIAQDADFAVRLRLSSQAGAEVTAVSKERGESYNGLEALHYSGPELDSWQNVNFLLGGVNSMEGAEQILIKSNGAKAALVMTSPQLPGLMAAASPRGDRRN